jgi:hypothetical protein
MRIGITPLDFITAMSPSSKYDILSTNALKALESDAANTVLQL